MTNAAAIDANTQLCAVIGNPIAHSLSPAIHNAAFRQLGLNFVYVAFRVESVGDALAGMRALENFRGMSVTIPHKIEAMKHVDEIPEVDRAIGSINTVISQGGKLTGLGTDGPGAMKAIVDAGVKMGGKNVLMLGAGGAARAIAFTLASHARLEKLMILDIDANLLEGLTSDLKNGTKTPIGHGTFDNTALSSSMAAADIVIHCTPVGMHPKHDVSLVPLDLFRPGQVIFDIVYNPLKTRLLSEAQAAGLKTISGVEMFINQAIYQFEHFTGKDAPEQVMRQVVMERLTS